MCNISTIVFSVHPFFGTKGLYINYTTSYITYSTQLDLYTPHQCTLQECINWSASHSIYLASMRLCGQMWQKEQSIPASWQITNKLQPMIVELSATISSVDFSTTISCHMRLQLFFSMIRILMNSCISHQLALPERKQHLLGSCGFAHRKCTREHPSAAICQLSSTCHRWRTHCKRAVRWITKREEVSHPQTVIWMVNVTME